MANKSITVILLMLVAFSFILQVCFARPQEIIIGEEDGRDGRFLFRTRGIFSNDFPFRQSFRFGNRRFSPNTFQRRQDVNQGAGEVEEDYDYANDPYHLFFF
ncbi:UNVERIFIED_CONTAM: hypothetical protein RMT77_005845 [Armadillidium vulgare]